MKIQLVNWRKYLAAIAALAVCSALRVHAQPFGGFGGFGGGNNNGGGGQNRTTATYNPAGSVGNATVMVDPDTHNLIVNADEETTKAMLQIVKNLDHPQPQVLIKVVFLEVTYNHSLDNGFDG